MAHNEQFEELAALQALGVPLGAEAGEFARHLSGCPICEGLLEDGKTAAGALAFAVAPRRPRPQLRGRILESLEPGRRPAPAPPPRRTPSPAPWLLAAAAVLLLFLAVGDDARLRRERESLRSETTDLSHRLSAAQQDLARRDLQVRVLESEDVRVLFLGGKAPQPDARGKVFWSAKAKRGVLLAGHLQALPAGKQYELWVFAAGKPVPAGVFDADPSGRALVESTDLSAIDAAQNFAVTVEPRGGVPAPTGPIILVGAP